jgi:hypothetical protein
MKITKRTQKLALLTWVAEGLSTLEINERASKFSPAFAVSKQQVDYYRKTRQVQLQVIQSIDESKALTEGYASKEHRVYKLSLVAALLEKDILGGMIWVSDVKGVGAGPAAEVVSYDYFNKAEIEAYRELLADIAAEMGDRSKALALTDPKGGPATLTVIYQDKKPSVDESDTST